MSKKYEKEDMLLTGILSCAITFIVFAIVILIMNYNWESEIEILGGMVCPEDTTFDKIENDVIYCKNIPKPEPEWEYVYDGTKIPIPRGDKK